VRAGVAAPAGPAAVAPASSVAAVAGLVAPPLASFCCRRMLQAEKPTPELPTLRFLELFSSFFASAALRKNHSKIAEPLPQFQRSSRAFTE